jgi:hypothetical protein
MQLDNKEKIMLAHYDGLFQKFLFDEYDVLGFLMLVREHIRNEKNKYPCILEFADLIAHRKRNQGKVITAIKAAMDNNYQTYDGKHVIGYHGIDEKSWKKEWTELFTDLNIQLNIRLLDEITICICSLANGSKYKDAYGHAGILYLAFSKNRIALITTEGGGDSLHVAFFVYTVSDRDIQDKNELGCWISETVRDDGILRMRDEVGNFVL